MREAFVTTPMAMTADAKDLTLPCERSTWESWRM
jgi:hypothetical protein